MKKTTTYSAKENIPKMKIVALAGGVGGAKMVDGLAECLPPSDLTVIVNTGDDFEHYGLKICPDLDTVCYTLAGLANSETGWGRAGESWRTLDEIKSLGDEAWFNLGDLDMATHMLRTQRLQRGELLSEITGDFCKQWGITVAVYPMSNSPVRTFIHTRAGRRLSFQEYFVRYQFKPEITEIEFEGIQKAQVPEAALDAIDKADAIIYCPSNPFVSIDPIIQIKAIGESIQQKKILAVSPLIGEHALKGPAAKMFRELGEVPSALNVAKHYRSNLSYFIMDNQDKEQSKTIEGWGIMCRALDILMPNRTQRKRLAREVLTFLEKSV